MNHTFSLIEAVYWRLSQLNLDTFDPDIPPASVLTLNDKQYDLYAYSAGREANFPYVLIKNASAGDFSTNSTSGQTGTLYISLWDRGQSVRLVSELSKAISETLNNLAFDFGLLDPSLSCVKILNFKSSNSDVNILEKDLIVGNLDFNYIII